MDFGDLFLTPVYILILYLLFRLFSVRHENAALKRYYYFGFWVKMVASVLFSLYYYYLSPGDPYNLYFTEGHTLFKHILDDPANVVYLFKTGVNYDPGLLDYRLNEGYLYSESNFVIIRITAFLCFFTFGHFLPINIIFAAFGFAGLWRLFLFFYRLKPQMHLIFAICILFFPSVVFWSAGLLKDTVCMGALGFMTWSLYKALYLRKKIFLNLLVFVFSAIVLGVVKIYILIAYLPLFILFMLLRRIRRIEIAFFRVSLGPALILFCVAAFAALAIKYQDVLGHYALEEVTSSIVKLNQGFSDKTGDLDAASNFELGVPFDPSIAGLARVAPFAVAATFYRPFIWEASKISHLMAAVESIFLMLFTLYVLFRSRIYKFIYYIFTDPLIMYCFFFAIAFGLFVGASTLNFGTLVRYKIPCLPFYTIALFLILEKLKKPKEVETS